MNTIANLKIIIEKIRKEEKEEGFYPLFSSIQEALDEKIENLFDFRQKNGELKTAQKLIEMQKEMTDEEKTLFTTLLFSYSYEGRYDGLTSLMRDSVAYKTIIRFINKDTEKRVLRVVCRVGGDEFFVCFINKDKKTFEFIFIDMSLLNFFNRDYDLGNFALKIIAKFMLETSNSMSDNETGHEFISSVQKKLRIFNEYVNEDDSDVCNGIYECTEYKHRYRQMVTNLFGHYLETIGLHADFGYISSELPDMPVKKEFISNLSSVASDRSTEEKKMRRPVWITDILAEYLSKEYSMKEVLKNDFNEATIYGDIDKMQETRIQLVRVESNIALIESSFHSKTIEHEVETMSETERIVEKDIKLHPFMEFYSYFAKNLKIPLENLVTEALNKARAVTQNTSFLKKEVVH